MFAKTRTINRQYVGKNIQNFMEVPDLISIQTSSYESFLQAERMKRGEPLENQGLQEVFTSTFPIVDLISEDQTLYVQVSTAQDAKKKVKDTLVNLKESDDKRISNVRKIVFFFLHNQSIDRIPDYMGDNMIGQVPFVRKEHLITTQDILEKAQNLLKWVAWLCLGGIFILSLLATLYYHLGILPLLLAFGLCIRSKNEKSLANLRS